MSLSAFYNMASFLLGLLALALPVYCMMRGARAARKTRQACSFLSFSACALSLCLQIFEANHRVNIGDFSALMDTWNTIAFVSAVLLAATFLLNLVVMVQGRKNSSEKD